MNLPRIAIFYHCLFVLGDPPKPLTNAFRIAASQMDQLAESGLLEAAEEFHVGVNGGVESQNFERIFFPEKAKITYHGLQSRSENPTLIMLENWVKTHPDWLVLYIHCKGATHPETTPGGRFVNSWRDAMMHDLVGNWQRCVSDLSRYDIVCSHWLWGQLDGTQHIPAGNFLWVNSSFAAKLPSLMLRDRIKSDGIYALISRHEAEVYWGNGPRPKVKSYRPYAVSGLI